MRFGCVLGDAEYGKVAKFRHALDDAGLLWALGVPPTQKVFAPGVTTLPQLSKRTGRPRKHPVPSEPSAPVSSLFSDPPDAARSAPARRRSPPGPPRPLPQLRTPHAMAHAGLNLAE